MFLKKNERKKSSNSKTWIKQKKPENWGFHSTYIIEHTILDENNRRGGGDFFLWFLFTLGHVRLG